MFCYAFSDKKITFWPIWKFWEHMSPTKKEKTFNKHVSDLN